MICRQGDGDESDVQRTSNLHCTITHNYGSAISFHSNT